MYQIHTIYTQWSDCNNHIKNLASSAFQPYLDDLLTRKPQLLSDTLRLGFLTRWEQTLRELFEHLRKNATPDYSDSLHKLRLLLLS
ncbi:hypothetical protein [Bacteroides thetaiotaomicron]|uniref:hypothetical protein n=1 Tax=Bacteroides thetaiotaomicron TaxID=818 RepID=UPI0039C159DB